MNPLENWIWRISKLQEQIDSQISVASYDRVFIMSSAGQEVHACTVCSVVSDSLQSHGLQPTRLLCPSGFPGKNTGVHCPALLQGIFPTQKLSPFLLHWKVYSLPTESPGSLGRGGLSYKQYLRDSCSCLVAMSSGVHDFLRTLVTSAACWSGLVTGPTQQRRCGAQVSCGQKGKENQILMWVVVSSRLPWWLSNKEPS